MNVENNLEQINTTQPEIEEVSAPLAEELSPVLIVPRTVFNYFVIALTFLIIGIAIGTMLANRAAQGNRELVSKVVAVALAAQAEAAATAAGPSLEDTNSRFTVSSDSDPSIGPEDAQVVMVEFSDFNCQYCRRFANETLPTLIETYGDRVRFVYRDFPILADSSALAALAAECANDQGKFWPYHDLLFNYQGPIDAALLTAFAQEINMDIDAFTPCLEEQRHITKVVSDYQEAQTLGVRGTPIFFINGRPVSGAQEFQVFADIIDEELAAADMVNPIDES